MKITLNGEPHEFEGRQTVAELVERLGDVQSTGRGVAVALNGEVVTRSRWATTALADEDRVEILRAVGGG
ncbi:MAG: sulfur carrier protein ThiS [Actinomycetota bacterium]